MSDAEATMLSSVPQRLADLPDRLVVTAGLACVFAIGWLD